MKEKVWLIDKLVRFICVRSESANSDYFLSEIERANRLSVKRVNTAAREKRTAAALLRPFAGLVQDAKEMGRSHHRNAEGLPHHQQVAVVSDQVVRFRSLSAGHERIVFRVAAAFLAEWGRCHVKATTQNPRQGT